MITVEEAAALVLERVEPLPSVHVPVGDSLHRVLHEDVVSDINSPPHDKSTMDGYAVLSSDSGELKVIEEVAAGDVPHHAVTPGSATRIMTGAPIPEGADAVVMIERTETTDDGRVRLLDPTITAGQYIMPIGTSLRRGEVVLTRGTEIRAVEVGLLAEVGHTRVEVTPWPSVAVMATGNELVPAGEVPGAGHLRNSNGPMLTAAALDTGANAVNLGVAPDDKQALGQMASSGFEQDVLILSGGVSAGLYDLVPQVLAELGVEQVFHKISLRPGKPMWFGVKQSGERRTAVFALPGNPVSSLVCFELFVRPAIRRLAGQRQVERPRGTARLEAEYHQASDRDTYHPASIHSASGTVDSPQAHAELVPWRGSGDLCALSAANALIVFPAGDHFFAPGDEVEVIRLD